MKDFIPEFSYIVETARLPAKGEVVEIKADDKQKKALAERLKLEKLSSFALKALVKPLNKHQVRVSGSVEGIVTQTCVVSLESFENTVKDDFTVLFEEQGEACLNVNEIDLDMGEEEDVETLENKKIDVGELAVEYFSLALDPFPHAPNVAFQHKTEGEGGKNAFSVLEKLKKA